MIYFNLFIQALHAAFQWATTILDKSGLASYFLGIIIITIVFNKLLAPLLRGRGSDHADRRRMRKDGGSENG